MPDNDAEHCHWCGEDTDGYTDQGQPFCDQDCADRYWAEWGQ